MKALVLFRSFYGNTKQVAEIIAQQIKTLGHEAEAQDLRLKLPDLNGIDAIVIGAPTRMARVSRKAKSVLRKLKKRGFGAKPVAVFDTYGPIPSKPEELEKSKKWLYPGAAGLMHELAKELGLNVYENTLRCEVAAAKGPLKEGENEKAAAFAKEFISAVGKKS